MSLQTLTVCMKCQEEDGLPNFSGFALERIPEDGVIDSTCSRGHRTFTIIQQTKFELLSEMAIRAIVDNYYRDAIASFAGALERLYEFFVRATCRKHGIEDHTFSAAWKPLARLSERQVGAFAAVYLLETGHAHKLLPHPQVELRNAIIHQGKFPDRDETIRFGQAVLECALPILELLSSDAYLEIVRALVTEKIAERSKKAWGLGLLSTTAGIATFLSLSWSAQPTNVEDAVAKAARRPDIARAVRQAQASEQS